MKSVRYTLVICPIIGMVALGCSAPHLDVRGHAFEDANVALWSYREAAREREYIRAYSYLCQGQRQTLEEVFYWLDRYNREPEVIKWVCDSLPNERYAIAFTFAGISPLHSGYVVEEDLKRNDVSAQRVGNSRRFQVKYRSSVGLWRIDPNIEYVLGPGGSAGSIKLLRFWAQEGEYGDRARKEMIGCIRKAIRAQNRLIRKARR